MYLLIEIIISILIASIPIIIYFKKYKEDKNKFLLAILASIILLIGCLVRTVAIESYPIGLNQDEVSSGYEAYAVLKYGIDRNGLTFPVHFIAWGSGQNALYSYLSMPFIMIFGNTIFSIRIVMAITGCITLLVAYFLFKDVFDSKKGLVALFIFSIIPWHILKSRWGLESNVFPDLIFYALTFIYFGLKYKKNKYFVISSIILGISTYAYGTSYLFVPIFSVITYVYFIIKKEITIKKGLLYLLITTIISLPMILFVIINYFNLDTIKILNISIPKLVHNRFTTVTSVNGNFLSNCYHNIKNVLIIMFKQNDGLILNYSPRFGILYKLSFPFILLGLFDAIKNKNNLLKLNNIVFISSIVLAFFTDPNINRINILWLCLIIYTVAGVVFLFKYIHNYIKILVIIIYGITFMFFSIDYFTNYQKAIGNTTFNGFEETLKYVRDKEYNKLYITGSINEPYIYYLYFNKINPNDYIKNRVFLIEDAPFQKIKNISNVYFFIPKELEEGNIYILSNFELPNYNTDGFEVEKIKNYNVIYN